MTAVCIMMASPSWAQDRIVKTIHQGVTIVGVQPDQAKTYDVTIMEPQRALEAIVEGFDLLLRTSPHAVADLATLKESGGVRMFYHPDFPFKNASSTGSTLAAFFPRSPFQEDIGPGKTYTVVFGRYIVKWDAVWIAIAISHELMGHGMQHYKNRLETMDVLDAECEAYLVDEDVRQRLGIDKRSDLSVRVRQGFEWKYCAPFKQYMTKFEPDTMALWQSLNPNIPALLGVFERYIAEAPTR